MIGIDLFYPTACFDMGAEYALVEWAPSLDGSLSGDSAALSIYNSRQELLAMTFDAKTVLYSDTAGEGQRECTFNGKGRTFVFSLNGATTTLTADGYIVSGAPTLTENGRTFCAE